MPGFQLQYYMNYTIYTSNASIYAIILASTSNTGIVKIAPRTAASTYGIPFPYPTGPVGSNPAGVVFSPPFIPGTSPFGFLVDDTVLNTTVNPGGFFPFGGVFTWSANVVFTGTTGTSPSTPIPQRRWICGREIVSQGGNFEGGSGIGARNLSRDSSRTIDGIGWYIRSNTALGGTWNHNIAENRPGLISATSRERFYFRVRSLPTTNPVNIWYGLCGTFTGWAFKINPTGNVEVWSVANTSVTAKQGTLQNPIGTGPNFPLELNKWYRLDLFYRAVVNSQSISVYLNGVPMYLQTINSASFGGANGHLNSQLGISIDLLDSTFECDFDDWINSDLFSNVDPTSLLFTNTNYSIDWLTGSHVRVHYAKSASQVNWSPAANAVGLLNVPLDPSDSGNSCTSTTSGATLEGLTDAPLQSAPDTSAVVNGAAAAIIAYEGSNAGPTNGQLGYRVAGGAPVLATITQQNVQSDQKVVYLPSGVNTPTEISPWSVTHTKSTDANLDTTRTITSVVEYLGIFGVEDDPTWKFPIPPTGWLHNCRYPNTQWGYYASQPPAPVYAVSGTYTGNGTYQEINLPAACHFLWIRGLTTGSQGIKLFGAALVPHLDSVSGASPNVRMFFDLPNNQFKFAVAGPGAEYNQNAAVFQYIAFCDPGMRFTYCSEFCHGNNFPTPSANPFVTVGFTPLMGFAQFDTWGLAFSGMYMQGQGSPVNNATALDATALMTNFGNFGTDIFNSQAGLHNINFIPVNYSAWRVLDSGTNGCANIAVQIYSYTGNGSGSNRIITPPPAQISGKFPCFIMISPTSASGVSYFKDPSHSGSNASRVDIISSLVTTAIVSVGVDTVTINTSVNTNAVTYQVFTIMGDSGGFNNGTFQQPFCSGTGPYVPPVTPAGLNIIGSGGLILDGVAPSTLLQSTSGLYQLITGKRNDTLIDRQAGQTSIDQSIPNINFKTGYVGG